MGSMKFLFLFFLAVSAVAQSPAVLLFGGRSTPPADTNPPVNGYTLWLHADDTTSLFTNAAGTVPADISSSDGRRIGKWLDRSTVAGTNHVVMDMLPSAGQERRPWITNSNPNAFNGKPSLYFSYYGEQSQTFLNSLTNNITFGAVTGLTVFAAVTAEVNIGDAYDMIFSWNDVSAKFWELHMNNQVRQIGWWDPGNASLEPNPPTITNKTGYCYGALYFDGGNTSGNNPNSPNGSLRVSRNGNASTSTSFSGTHLPLAGWLGIGHRGQSGSGIANFWSGSIAEVIVYPWGLSQVEFSNVNYYVTNKYNLHEP
jgi:hypothetical protein